MQKLIIQNLIYKLKDFDLDINLDISFKNIIAVCGQSGSAKTTLLRCIAGLNKTEQGIIQFNDVTWQKNSYFVPTHLRSIGYVFQESNLFSHLNVEKNLKYGLKRNLFNNPFKFEEIIQLFKIEKLLKRYPHELSGGEKQKVAIARAVLSNPRLLLMDEPLASIDQTSKFEILNFIKKLHINFKIPIIYVSHSSEEVANLTNNVINLYEGKLLSEE